MNEFIQKIVDSFNQNPVALCGIAFSVVAEATALFFGLRTFFITRALKKAKERDTFVRCPKCGTVTPLKDLDFFLPGGSKDNNLNGKPDEEE